MVVQCQSCRARFRVADEKVTDRGVRVRCTSCKTIFLVRKDGIAETASQAPTGETVMGMAPISLVPPARQPGPAPGVRLAPSAPPPARPSASAPPAARLPPPPPAARNGAPKRPPAAAPADPLGDPFGMDELTGDLPKPSAPPPARPFPAASKPAPAARPAAPPSKPPPPAPPKPKPPDLPELDLGLDDPPEPQRAPGPSRPPPPVAEPESPGLPIGKLTRPAKPKPAEAPAAPSRPPPPPSVFDDVEVDDKPAAPPPPVQQEQPAHDPFAGMDLDSNEHSDVAPLRPSDPALGRLGPDEGEAPAPHEPAATPPATEGGGSSADDDQATAGAARPPRSMRRLIISSTLTGLIAAVVAAALVLGPTAFTDGGVLRLFGVGRGSLVVVAEASGLYDTASGRPVFFVRGHVENRGQESAGPIRVIALLVGDSGTTARAEATAGVEGTPEDVYGIHSAAEAASLMKTLAQKRPGDRRVAAGSSLPFLALFADPPADLSGQHLQLRLEQSEAATAH